MPDIFIYPIVFILFLRSVWLYQQLPCGIPSRLIGAHSTFFDHSIQFQGRSGNGLTVFWALWMPLRVTPFNHSTAMLD